MIDLSDGYSAPIKYAKSKIASVHFLGAKEGTLNWNCVKFFTPLLCDEAKQLIVDERQAKLEDAGKSGPSNITVVMEPFKPIED